MKFPAGTPVVQRTGGPVMIVTDEIELTCTWAADGRYRIQEFQQEDLLTLTDWMVRAHEASKK